MKHLQFEILYICKTWVVSKSVMENDSEEPTVWHKMLRELAASIELVLMNKILRETIIVLFSV